MTAPAPDSAPAAPVPPSNKTALFVVFFVVFIDLLGFGIVLPLMPRLAVEYMSGFTREQIGLTVGLLYSSFSLMQFVFSPMWGRWSDRVGRRPVIIISLAGSVVCYALFGFACTLPSSSATLALVLLFVSRTLAGIAGASVSTATAVIADSTAPEKRAHGMALIGAAFGIGFTFGPLIAYAGLVGLPSESHTVWESPSEPLFDYGPDNHPADAVAVIKERVRREYLWVPGGIASALSLVALLIAVRKLPETLKPGNVATSHGRRGFSISRATEVIRMPAVGPLILIYFLAIFAFANFEATLALYTEEVLHFDDKANFLVFAGVGLVLMVAQGGVYRRYAKTVPEVRLASVGLVFMFVGLGGLAAIAFIAYQAGLTGGYTGLFYLTTAVAVFGFAFVNPSVTALVSRNADPSRQGEILGVNQSFAALGRIFGPLCGAFVFYQHASHSLPFLVAGGVLVLVVFLLVGYSKNKPAEPPAS